MRTLQQFVDEAAFAHVDAAIALREAVGTAEPHIDLATGTATFHTAAGPRTFGIQLIGSEDAASTSASDDLDVLGALFAGADAAMGDALASGGTWEWGWARPDLVPLEMLALAQHVRAVGEREGVDELRAPAVPLEHVSVAHLVIAAKAAAGRVASIVVPGAPGVHVHLMLEGIGGSTPAARHASTAITHALAQGLVEDHGRALRAYAAATRMGIVELARDALALETPDGRIEVFFDEDGRIERLATRDGDHNVRAIRARPGADAAPLRMRAGWIDGPGGDQEGGAQGDDRPGAAASDRAPGQAPPPWLVSAPAPPLIDPGRVPTPTVRAVPANPAAERLVIGAFPRLAPAPIRTPAGRTPPEARPTIEPPIAPTIPTMPPGFGTPPAAWPQ